MKSKKEFVEELKRMIEPLVLAEGFELLELEFQREPQGYVLRIFIDAEEGVTIEDCSRVSYLVSDFLDVADPIHHNYHLEVSSPGVDRPLTKPSHFARYKGNVVKIKTDRPIQNRRNFKGLLVDSNDETIAVNCDGVLFSIPISFVEKARLSYFDSQTINKKRNGKK